MRDAGIEPDVERVAHLAVLAGFVAEQFLGIQRKPGFDTGLFDTQGDFFDQFGGARVQRRMARGRSGQPKTVCVPRKLWNWELLHQRIWQREHLILIRRTWHG